MTRIVGGVARQAWPLGLAAAAFALAAGLPTGDPDMWWHLASGRWMVDHRDGLRVDIFSSTVTGMPYALGGSLGDVLLYLVYAGASWTGIAVLRAAGVAVAAFSVSRTTLRFAPAAVAVPLATVAAALSVPAWTAGPQLFTLAFFPVLLDLLLAARTGSRAALATSVPLLFVWSALDAGYAFGLALLWIFAFAALLERRSSGPPFVAAAGTTFLVSLDPGALPLFLAFDHLVVPVRGIAGAAPVDVLTPFGALFALLLALTLGVSLTAGADVLAVVVLVPFLALALLSQRHIPLFAFVATPFVAASLTRLRSTRNASRSTEGPRERGGPPDRRAVLTSQGTRDKEKPPVGRVVAPRSLRGFRWSGERSALLVTGLWLLAIASIATAPRQPDLSAYPTGALSALRGSTGVVLNEYDWGGYLIWSAPERRVFIDGRLFPFIADDVLGGYRRTLRVLPGWRAVLDHWNVTQALLRPGEPLTQALRDEGWIVLTEDARAVLLERRK